MKKKLFYLTAIILIGFLGWTTYLSSKKVTPVAVPQPEKVHFHAGFVVFDNGKKVDFSGLQYMDIEPCKLNEDEEEIQTAEELQHEKAHLHDNVGDVVHSHVEGAKWGDLFANINYSIDNSKVTAFINGIEVNDIKNIPIKAYDSLIIFVGNVDKQSLASQGPGKKLLSQAVTVDHIKQTEMKSETCGE